MADALDEEEAWKDFPLSFVSTAVSPFRPFMSRDFIFSRRKLIIGEEAML
jgi:hypothetical protein